MGQRIDFLKLLFDGHALTLPIKGSQVQKSDNPPILCASNHSLRDLFYQKFRYSCGCRNLPYHSLCESSTPECTFPRNIRTSYAALAARLHEIEITDPIFPPKTSSFYGKPLWPQWNQFLIDCTIAAPSLASALGKDSAPGCSFSFSPRD